MAIAGKVKRKLVTSNISFAFHLLFELLALKDCARVSFLLNKYSIYNRKSPEFSKIRPSSSPEITGFFNVSLYISEHTDIATMAGEGHFEGGSSTRH